MAFHNSAVQLKRDIEPHCYTKDKHWASGNAPPVSAQEYRVKGRESKVVARIDTQGKGVGGSRGIAGAAKKSQALLGGEVERRPWKSGNRRCSKR